MLRGAEANKWGWRVLPLVVVGLVWSTVTPLRGDEPPAATAPRAAVGTGSATSDAIDDARIVTEEEALAWTREFLEAFADENIDRQPAMFAWTRITAEAWNRMGYTAAEREGVLKLLEETGAFADVFAFVPQPPPLQSYQVLRARQRSGCRTVIIRTDPAEYLHYVELRLQYEGDQVRCTDTFSPRLGRWDSEPFAEMFVNQLTFKNETEAAKLLARSGKQIDKLSLRIWQVVNAQASQPWAEVQELYRDLPPAAQSRPDLCRAILPGALDANDTPMIERLREVLKAAYADDRTLCIPLHDIYVNQQDWPAALECLDTLDMLVDTDPQLNGLRASHAASAGDWDKSLQLARKLLTDEPTSETAFDRVAAALNNLGRFDELVTLLQGRPADSFLSPDLFEEFEEYKPFVKSPAFMRYAQWYDAHAPQDN